jgi:drug/metabolite transporter (DMT)-like permease
MRTPPALAFAACAFIWGTTWLAIKIGYGGLDPVWGASLRFFIASLLLIPFIVARGLPPPLGARQVGVVVFVGLTMFWLDYGLIYWGEQFVPSGLTAVLFATMPLFVALFSGLLIPTEGITKRHALGMGAAFLGLVLVFQQELHVTGSLAGMIAIVLSAVAAAASSVVVRRWGKDLPAITLNASAMMIGGIALFASSLALGEHPALPRSTRSWLSLLYLVVLGSIVSFLLYWGLLKSWSANRASLIPIVTPVIALTSGLLVGERLGALQWLGSAIVLAGVASALAPLPQRASALAAPAGAQGK